MLTFKDFVKVRNRLCKSYVTCTGCPIHYIRGESLCIDWCFDNPEKVTKVVQEWLDAHPNTTIEQKFTQKYPNKPWKNFGAVGLKYTDCNNDLPCPYCNWWNEESE